MSLSRNRNFVALVTSQGLSVTGREISTLVLPLLVLAIADSPAHLGFVAATQALPYLVLSLPAGALIDRWDRRSTLIVCEWVRAVALASLPLTWWFGELSLVQIYLVALITGSAFVFANLAEVAMLPAVVTSDQLPRATSVNIAIERTGGLAAPAAAGALMGLGATPVIGAMLAFAVQSVMQAFAALGFGTLQTKPARQPEAAPTASALAREIREGLSWLLGHQEVRLLAAVALALNIVFAPVTLAIIAAASQNLNAAPLEIGLLFSIAGVGGLLVTLIAPWFREHFRVGHIVVGCLIVWAAGMLLIPTGASIINLCVGWMIVTSVGAVYDVAATSYRLALIPEGLQGRVNSAFRFTAFGVRPVALALGGVLIAELGAFTTLWILAGAMCLLALFIALSSARRMG